MESLDKSCRVCGVPLICGDSISVHCYEVKNWICKGCNSVRMKKWRKENGERVREYNLFHYRANQESRKQYARDYRKVNLERYRKQDRLRNWRLQAIDITYEHYQELLKMQGGVCAICKNPPKRRPLNVDHNHETGGIRSLLCTRCNKDIAVLESKMLLKYQEYLDRWSGNGR